MYVPMYLYNDIFTIMIHFILRAHRNVYLLNENVTELIHQIPCFSWNNHDSTVSHLIIDRKHPSSDINTLPCYSMYLATATVL